MGSEFSKLDMNKAVKITLNIYWVCRFEELAYAAIIERAGECDDAIAKSHRIRCAACRAHRCTLEALGNIRSDQGEPTTCTVTKMTSATRSKS